MAIPSAPAHLDQVARAEWRRVVRPLAAVGLLTLLDRTALAAYCMAWSRWVAAEKKLRQVGSIVTSARGGPRLSPFLTIANVALKQMREFLSEFGMSPASRTRIQVDKAPIESELDRFRRRRHPSG